MDTTREGDWIQLYSGHPFWPTDPRAEDLCIEDIAHSLALENRYSGATRVPYSVAEHSVRVAEYVRARAVNAHWDAERVRNATLAGLLHDGSEGLGWKDIARPLKYHPKMRDYREGCKNCQQVVWDAFGAVVTEDVLRLVKEADNVLLATEKRDLLKPSSIPWGPLPDPLPDVIIPWNWEMAERRFLRGFVKNEVKR